MGVLPTGEKTSVLKLVYPGRYVEIYTQPITAAEVMRKNPRHCVARPDVFKFPYIVVRPESVLSPGSVFYVVPNRTIYRLLKARGGPHNQTSKNPASRAPKHQNHQNHDRCLKKQKQLQYSPFDGVSYEEEDFESSVDSTVEIRTTKAYHCKNEDYAKIKCHDEQVHALKSCLRKHDSARKNLNLRVSFAFPITSSGETPALQQGF